MSTELTVDQKILREELSEHFEAMPDGWFQNELFEQTRDYLTRGRRFERMRGNELNEEWVKLFRRYVRLHIGPHVCDMADLWAELRLRGAELPTHLVTLEMEQLRTTIIWTCAVPPSTDLDRASSKFIEDPDRSMDRNKDSKLF